MKPIIGVTTSINADTTILQMNRSYTGAIEHAGGIPLLLPATLDEAVIARYASLVDGLLLSGGDDVDPARYGEWQRWDCGDICPLRDAFELALCTAFLPMRKPVLGICRGIQVLNVALGGTLYQDLAHQAPDSLAHRQKQNPCHTSHPVTISEGSLLHKVVGCCELQTNSHHHQAVKALGDGLHVTASAPDGIIEAVELFSHPFCLGVQWHPERLWDQQGGAAHASLFQAFVDACSE